MRVVSPYRAFVAEAHPEAEAITAFDWIAALRMLNYSVERAYGTSVIVLTDEATVVPLTAARYRTTATRLQQWLIEIRLAYLESDAFDQDTILISPDTLLLSGFGDVFAPDVDLAVMVRTGAKFQGQWKAILNSVQWWRHRAKDRLIAFYRRALAMSHDLPEELQVWGGDTEALRTLLEPITLGVSQRSDLNVEMILAKRVFRSLDTNQIAALEAGIAFPMPSAPIFDFKYTRKQYMRQAFETLFPEAVL